MATHLPGESNGQRSLVGYSPWGCKELDMTEHTCSVKFYSLHIFFFLFKNVLNVCVYLCLVAPGNLPNPGIEPVFHIAGGFFTIWGTREVLWTKVLCLKQKCLLTLNPQNSPRCISVFSMHWIRLGIPPVFLKKSLSFWPVPSQPGHSPDLPHHHCQEIALHHPETSLSPFLCWITCFLDSIFTYF